MKADQHKGASQPTLLSYVERIERLLTERDEINELISDVKKQAKSFGFNTKVINQMIKERAMTESARLEWLDLCETYREALGMLAGTPLGNTSIRRFEDSHNHALEPSDEVEEESLGETSDAASPTPDDARTLGAEAFKEGKSVIANPFGALDPCRAAWDEGWCISAGSDGMELPQAWRRSPPDESGGNEATP